jgi:spermidine synthase
VVELEPGLLEVARRWFGFEEGEGLRVEAGDGVKKVVKGPDAEQWDLMVVDVDNHDPSIGVSCPGPDFLTPAFLQVGARLGEGSPLQA